MNTYQSLLRIAGRLPTLDARENDEDYLKRLVLAVSSVPIPAYEAMPPDARQWFDDAADALSAGMRIPLPEGFDRNAALAATPAQMVATHETQGLGYPQRQIPASGAGMGASGAMLIRRPGGAAYTSPPPAPSQRPQRPFSEPRPGEPVRDTVIRLMIADPAMSAETLMRRLAEHHIQTTLNTTASQRAFVMTTLRLIQEAGWKPPQPNG